MLAKNLITCHNRVSVALIQRLYTTTTQTPYICKLKFSSHFRLNQLAVCPTLNVPSELDHGGNNQEKRTFV